jgi:hypothetical protein
MRGTGCGRPGGAHLIRMTIRNIARFFQPSLIDCLWASSPGRPRSAVHVCEPFVAVVGTHVGIDPFVEPVGPFRQLPWRPVAATPTFTNLRVQPIQPPIAGAIAILTRVFSKVLADLFQAVEATDPISDPRFCELRKAEGSAKIRFAV